MNDKPHCTCHKLMGNDFYFLPANECLKGGCDMGIVQVRMPRRKPPHGPEAGALFVVALLAFAINVCISAMGFPTIGALFAFVVYIAALA